MNAKEARELYEKIVKNVNISPHVERIDNIIKHRCLDGKCSMYDPHVFYDKFGTLRELEGEVYDKVKQHYVDQGYEWKEIIGGREDEDYVILEW